jgi:hypothetical protein
VLLSLFKSIVPFVPSLGTCTSIEINRNSYCCSQTCSPSVPFPYGPTTGKVRGNKMKRREQIRFLEFVPSKASPMLMFLDWEHGEQREHRLVVPMRAGMRP